MLIAHPPPFPGQPPTKSEDATATQEQAHQREFSLWKTKKFNPFACYYLALFCPHEELFGEEGQILSVQYFTSDFSVNG